MLTSEDIKNLTEYQKLVFVTQESFDKAVEKLGKSISNVQSSVDGIAKDNTTKSQEIPTLNYRMKETENWIDKAAVKLGIKFEH